MKRVLLSVPHMGGAELGFVREAFETNWMSTVGPNLTAFEAEFSRQCVDGIPSVAVASGTAAIHLGLRALGVGPGDEVVTSDLNFIAGVNPVVYQGARPIFVDSERASWNMDPELLAQMLKRRADAGRPLPKACVVVHLYGQPADLDAITGILARYDVPLLEDAAEALGALHNGRKLGTIGAVSAFSFNGNKVITTTGGGVVTAKDPRLADKCRYWATQAREPRVEYHHTEVGYNYRMSNVLAGIGRGQLHVLEGRVASRRAVQARYAAAFADLPGMSPMPEAPWARHTHWLSVFQVDPTVAPIEAANLIKALDAADVESRPVWKPMHLQPVNAAYEAVGGEVGAKLYRDGICLPSSSSLTEEDQERVIVAVRGAFRAG
jgi:pyridoxal phosphate-dependent aminotransferase EpsN